MQIGEYNVNSVWLGLGAVFASWIWICIYRVFFHPLAKYPGPFIAKITDFYNVYYCFGGDRHLEFYRIHQKYGDIVRYGPNRVSINTASALHTIYSHKANVQKSGIFHIFTQYFPGWSTQTIIDVHKNNHPGRRRVLAEALTGKALAKMESRVNPIITEFNRLLAGTDEPKSEKTSAWSLPKDMAQWAGYLAFDVMGQICFSKSFDMLHTEKDRDILSLLINGARCLNTLGHMQGLAKTGIPRLFFGDLLAGLKRYRNFSSQQCEARKAIAENEKEGDSYDVLGHVLKAKNPKTGDSVYQPIDLVSESSLLIIAGSDTTSTCLAATIFYLLDNPETLKRAQDEVRSKFSNLEDIRSSPALNECVYLRACIDESLRLSPPVAALMPRDVKAGGFTIDGHFFAEGTEVGTPHYAVQHKEEYYPKPFAFDPTRWLEDEVMTPQKEESLRLARDGFCAWSLGPRSCVGKTMAYMELSMVLGKMLFSYEMQFAEGGRRGNGRAELGKERGRPHEYQLYDAFASQSFGPQVQFKPREIAATA